MKWSLQRKLQRMAYNNRRLNKKLCCLKKSWDEVCKSLCECDENKKKGKRQ